MDRMPDKYRLKNQLLIQRCQHIQRDNERLVDLLHQTRSLVSRFQRQQQVLIKRLSRYDPDFRTSRLPLYTEVKREGKAAKSAKAGSATAAAGSSRSAGKKVKVENGKEGRSGCQPVPKKPINPYLLFCQMNRTAVLEEQQTEQKGDVNNQELTKALALKWKFLTQDQKELYYRLYHQDKERYDAEMKLFAASSEAPA